MPGPTDEATDLGPLSSSAHQAKVAGMVERARDYAKVVTGGRTPGGDLARGCYYEPTLVSDVPLDSGSGVTRCSGRCSRSWRSTTTTRRSGSPTTRHSAWPPRPGLATPTGAGRATREIKAGCVWVNDHILIISEMPHGGYRHSGFGKDMSGPTLDEYTNVKHVMHDNTAVAEKPWHRTIFTLPR